MRGLGVCKGRRVFFSRVIRAIIVRKGMWGTVLVEVDAAVGEFAEGSLFLQLCRNNGQPDILELDGRNESFDGVRDRETPSSNGKRYLHRHTSGLFCIIPCVSHLYGGL